MLLVAIKSMYSLKWSRNGTHKLLLKLDFIEQTKKYMHQSSNLATRRSDHNSKMNYETLHPLIAPYYTRQNPDCNIFSISQVKCGNKLSQVILGWSPPGCLISFPERWQPWRPERELPIEPFQSFDQRWTAVVLILLLLFSLNPSALTTGIIPWRWHLTWVHDHIPLQYAEHLHVTKECETRNTD